MSERKKIRALHITPVIVATFLSGFFALVLEGSKILVDVETPFSTSSSLEAAVYNTTIFLILVGFGSLLLFILLKLKKLGLIKLLFLSSLAISFLGIIEIYMIAFSVYYGKDILLSENLSLLIAAIASLATVYVIATSRNEYLIAALMILYGSSAGSLFGVLLPIWTILAVAIALSVYDLYSVFKGPLKYLIELEKKSSKISNERKTCGRDSLLKGVVVPFKGLYLGIGDVIFYSMISSASLIKPEISMIRFLAVIFGVSIGAYITFKLVEKKGALPALPIPMLLSVILYISFLLLEI